jgi:hypothetical protein
MGMREWLAGVLESVGLRGLRHQVLPETPDELRSRRLGQIEEEVQRAVEKALAGWRPPTGEDLSIASVDVMDEEYGDLVGEDLWIDLGFAGEGARKVPEHYFLRLAPAIDPPGPDATPAQRAAYQDYLEDADRTVPVPAPLAPATMAWLEDLEQRTVAAAGQARPGMRVHVTFGGLLPDPDAS